MVEMDSGLIVGATGEGGIGGIGSIVVGVCLVTTGPLSYHKTYWFCWIIGDF